MGFHHGLGMAWGPVYTLLAGRSGTNPVVAGLLTGAAMSIIADDINDACDGSECPQSRLPASDARARFRRPLGLRGNPRYPGLTPCRMELDSSALVAQKGDIVHGYREKKYESLVGGRVHIERGHVQFVDPHTVEIDGKRLTGEKLLIATGSHPVVPDMEGSDQVPYLTSDLLTVAEQIELMELPKSLLIVGGGYIALELGQMFHRFGTEVTIVDRNAQLLAHGYEPEVGQAIGQVFSEEGIRVVTEGPSFRHGHRLLDQCGRCSGTQKSDGVFRLAGFRAVWPR